MLICLIGTGGTGKSTLAKEVAKELDIFFTPIPTRRVPLDLRCTPVGQRMVLGYYYQMFESLDQDAICDRCVLDAIAYSIAYDCWDAEEIEKEIDRYKSSSVFPDHIFYLPIEFPLKADGDRETFEEKRIAVDDAIKGILDNFDIPYVTLTGTVGERLDKLIYYIDKI